MQYVAYDSPKVHTDVDECVRVDAVNAVRHKENETSIPAINALLKNMGLQAFRNPAPQEYAKNARRLYQRKIREPDYKTLMAVEALAKDKTEPRYPVRDYAMSDAVEFAELACLRAFIDGGYRAPVDISALLPRGHAEHCNCDGLWDGVSAECAGTRRRRPEAAARVCWRADEKLHHFMDPHYVPHVY